MGSAVRPEPTKYSSDNPFAPKPSAAAAPGYSADNPFAPQATAVATVDPIAKPPAYSADNPFAPTSHVGSDTTTVSAPHTEDLSPDDERASGSISDATKRIGSAPLEQVPIDLTHRGTSRSWGAQPEPEMEDDMARRIRMQHAAPSPADFEAAKTRKPSAVEKKLAEMQQKLKLPNAKDEQAMVDKVFGANEKPGYVAPHGSPTARAIDKYVKPVARGVVGAGQMVDAAVEHPIETAAGMIMAPITSGGVATQYALQKMAEHIGPENAARLKEMVDLGEPVKGADAGWAVAQLMALAAAGPMAKVIGKGVTPLLPRALQASAADLVSGETAASMASRGAATSTSRAGAVIGHGASGATVGATYSPDDPLAGAVGMGIVGGGLAGAFGAKAEGSAATTARDVDATRAKFQEFFADADRRADEERVANGPKLGAKKPKVAPAMARISDEGLGADVKPEPDYVVHGPKGTPPDIGHVGEEPGPRTFPATAGTVTDFAKEKGISIEEAATKLRAANYQVADETITAAGGDPSKVATPLPEREHLPHWDEASMGPKPTRAEHEAFKAKVAETLAARRPKLEQNVPEQIGQDIPPVMRASNLPDTEAPEAQKPSNEGAKTEDQPAAHIPTHDIQTIANVHDLHDLARQVAESRSMDLETAHRTLVARMGELQAGGMAPERARATVETEFAPPEKSGTIKDVDSAQNTEGRGQEAVQRGAGATAPGVGEPGTVRATTGAAGEVSAADAGKKAGAVAQAEASPAELKDRPKVSGVDGEAGETFLSTGKKIATKYRVIEADDLQPSHHPETFAANPNYPAGVQGREYAGTRGEAARSQVMTGALRPEVVLDRGSGTTDGPPVITHHGVVVAGNDRSMRIQRAARMSPEQFSTYRTELAKRAQGFGIDPTAIEGMKSPVLVRQIDDESVDVNDAKALGDLNRASDTAPTKTKDQVTAAMSRAKAMQGATAALSHMTETMDPESTVRDYLSTGHGRDFVRELVKDGVIVSQELPAFVDKASNAIHAEGKQKIEDMLLAAAIGDADVMSRAPSAVLKKIGAGVPAIVSANQVPGYSMAATLQGALDIHAGAAAMRDEVGSGKRSIADFLGQGDMFGREFDANAKDLALFLEDAKASDVTTALRAYAKEAMAGQRMASSHDMFGHEPEKAGAVQKRVFALHEDKANFEKAVADPTGPEAHAIDRDDALKAYGSVEARDQVRDELAPAFAQIRAAKFQTTEERQAQIDAAPDVTLIPVGTDVSDPHTLLAAATVIRHPKAEHFSYILRDKTSGKVLEHAILTSGMLNTVTVPWEQLATQVADRIDALGGPDRIESVGIHNHPSGKVASSIGDRMGTQVFDRALRERGITLAGHLIIDHDTGNWMTVDPETGDIQEQTISVPGANRLAPWKTGAQLGQPSVTRSTDAAIARDAVSPKGVTVFHLDFQRQIVAVHPVAPGVSIPSLAARIMRDRVALGSHEVIVAAPGADAHSFARAAARARLTNDAWGHYVLDVLRVTPTTSGPAFVASLADHGVYPSPDEQWQADFEEDQPLGSSLRASTGPDMVPDAGRSSGVLGARQLRRPGVREPDLFGNETPEEKKARLNKPIDYSKAITAEEMAQRAARGETKSAVEGITGEEPLSTSKDERQIPLLEDRPKFGKKDRIVASAIRTKEGRVFSGQIHAMARLAAEEAGLINQSAAQSRVGGPFDKADWEEGFLTADGRYVSREDAEKITRANGQFNRDADDGYEGELDATEVKGLSREAIRGRADRAARKLVRAARDQRTMENEANRWKHEELLRASGERYAGLLDQMDDDALVKYARGFDQHGLQGQPPLLKVLKDRGLLDRVQGPHAIGEPRPGFDEPAPVDDDKKTGIKNAASAADRDTLGLGDRNRPEPRTQDEMYAAGKALDAADPGAMDRLMKELADDPEKIVGTKAEAGLLLKHRVDLDNHLKELIAAKDEALSNQDPIAEALARMQLAAHRETIRDFVQLAERTGTATGRALAARRMMSTLDYSLSAMEAMAEAAKGSALTDDELTKIKALHDELNVKLAAAEKDVADARERAANAEADLHHAQLTLEAQAPLIARLTTKLDTAADRALARIKARGLRAMAGMDPEDLADHAIVGAAELARGAVKFADWSEAMMRKVGASIRPHLEEIFAASGKEIEKAVKAERPKGPAKPKAKKPADIFEKMQARMTDGESDLSDLRPYLRKLALEHINDGVTDREPLLTALHDDVIGAGILATRAEVRDALSGYGDFKPLDKAADKVRLREIQAEAQKLAQLEALEKGQAPKATGFERQGPSDEARRLTQQVNAAKKKAGIGEMDEAGRLKSALSAAKTRTRNAIKDLQTEIDTGERIVSGKSVIISDPELDALRKQLADLRKTEAEVFGPSEMTDAQRLDLATKAAKRAADAWDDRLNQARKGTFSPKGTARQLKSTPELDALKAKAARARSEYNELKGLDPAQRQQAADAANRAYRTHLAQQEADLLDRMARQDYSPKPLKVGTMLDRESIQRKTEVEAVKAKYQQQLRAYEKAHRSGLEKARDWSLAWVRFGALSWPTVIGKLTSVAVTRVITTPITDLAALGVANALPGLAARAPRFGVRSPRVLLEAEARAWAGMWIDGIKSSGQMIQNKRSRLELLHGKDKVPPELADYMGRLHGALKEPIKEAEYARSLYRRTTQAALAGENITDPVVQMRLSTEAYLDADRAVSMNKNIVTDWWNAGLKKLQQKDKVTGKPNPLGLMFATILQADMPIVKAPVNVMLEASEYIAGLPIGGFRAAWEYVHGLEDLKPVEADSIIRMIAKGAVGAAIMALYFYKHDQVEFGGFYQPGEKRSPDDVPVGAARIGGTVIPKTLLHNPLLEAGQFAATVARVAPTKLRKKDADPQGYESALFAASIGLLDETPLIGSLVSDARKLDDPKQRNDFVATKAANIAVPGVIQWVAKKTDDPDIKRKPEGLKQHLEYNLPILRKNVPTADFGKPLPKGQQPLRPLRALRPLKPLR